MIKSDGAAGSWLRRFAQADDHEDANGSTIHDFWQACDVARKLARGDDAGVEVEAGRPVTVSEAIDAYARNLRARNGGVANATTLRTHLPHVLLSKPVAMLGRPRGAYMARRPTRQGADARDRQQVHEMP